MLQPYYNFITKFNTRKSHIISMLTYKLQRLQKKSVFIFIYMHIYTYIIYNVVTFVISNQKLHLNIYQCTFYIHQLCNIFVISCNNWLNFVTFYTELN